MIWEEEQLGVYRFDESGNTPYIPLRADMGVKAEKLWVCGYGEYSGVSELPVKVELFGCDGYMGTSTDTFNYYPGLGIVTNSLALDMPGAPDLAWLDGNYSPGMFGMQWRYDVSGTKTEGSVRKYPRLAIRFEAIYTEDWPTPDPVWASAKILYGWTT